MYLHVKHPVFVRSVALEERVAMLSQDVLLESFVDSKGLHYSLTGPQYPLVAFKMCKGREGALIVWYLSYQRSPLGLDLSYLPRG